MGEGWSTAFGDATKGWRFAQHELLFYRNMASWFQLEQSSTEVAARGLSLGAQPCALRLFYAAGARAASRSLP